MKTIGLSALLNFGIFSLIYAQDGPNRGPYNTWPGGVVDGVAIQDEVPMM